MESTMEDRIRQHAYFLWLDNNRTGDATSFWLAAERAVLAEVEQEAVTALQQAQAAAESAARQLARRVNALVLLESGSAREEPELGIAAE
jgi:Protein of unknown function (DUF2934)